MHLSAVAMVNQFALSQLPVSFNAVLYCWTLSLESYAEKHLKIQLKDTFQKFYQYSKATPHIQLNSQLISSALSNFC